MKAAVHNLQPFTIKSLTSSFQTQQFNLFRRRLPPTEMTTRAVRNHYPNQMARIHHRLHHRSIRTREQTVTMWIWMIWTRKCDLPSFAIAIIHWILDVSLDFNNRLAHLSRTNRSLETEQVLILWLAPGNSSNTREISLPKSASENRKGKLWKMCEVFWSSVGLVEFAENRSKVGIQWCSMWPIIMQKESRKFSNAICAEKP